jgi:DNA-binding NarL/FixJ family response regulator
MEVVRRSGPGSAPRGLRGHAGTVFHFIDRESSESFAFKVYLSNTPGLRERQERISAHLSTLESRSCFVDLEYLQNGIFVNERWYPAVIMKWSPGAQLDSYLRSSITEADAEQLIIGWIDTVAQLRKGQILHGDLQFGNILVEQPNRIRLVDYDGMLVPGIDGAAGELERGHEDFQHPARTTGKSPRLTPALEDFSALVVLTNLLCLANGLWQDFRTEEGLAIHGMDLLTPNDSSVLQTFAQSGGTLSTVTRLLLSAIANVDIASTALEEATAELGRALPPRHGSTGTTRVPLRRPAQARASEPVGTAFTDADRRVIEFLRDRLSNAAIAAQLDLPEPHVRRIVAQLQRRLGVSARSAIPGAVDALQSVTPPSANKRKASNARGTAPGLKTASNSPDAPLREDATHRQVPADQFTLSTHEIEILTALRSSDRGRQGAAEKLGISTATLARRVSTIKRKLNVSTDQAALTMANMRGLLPQESQQPSQPPDITQPPPAPKVVSPPARKVVSPPARKVVPTPAPKVVPTPAPKVVPTPLKPRQASRPGGRGLSPAVIGALTVLAIIALLILFF